MFAICHFKSNPEDEFILFDKDEFKVDEMGIEIEDTPELNKNYLFNEKKYNNLPLLSYSDLILRVLNSKIKTISHKLSTIKIETLNDLLMEVDLIEAKISNLSRSERESVMKRFHEIEKCKNQESNKQESQQ